MIQFIADGRERERRTSELTERRKRGKQTLSGEGSANERGLTKYYMMILWKHNSGLNWTAAESKEEKEKRQIIITKNIFHYLGFIFHSPVHTTRADARREAETLEIKKREYSQIYVCLLTFSAIAREIFPFRKYFLSRELLRVNFSAFVFERFVTERRKKN